MKQPEYTWDEEQGIASCTLYYSDQEFIGMAICHPDDRDMQSKLTGQNIAEFRALIQAWRYKRDCELRPQLRALNQLYYSMNRSKYFDPTSYETKMLYRQINNIKNELEAVKIEIKVLTDDLKNYINIKEIYHNTVRERREAKDN